MDQELNRGLASTQLSRKDLLVRGATAAALVGATGLLAACGASTSGGTSAAASSSAGGSLGNVDFLSWAGYDLQPPMEAWRKANGVQLNTTYINTQEDVLTKLRSGGTADVSTYFTTFYGQMRDLNLLTELDPKRLPNFTPELIAPGLYDQPYWFEDGKLWGVPMEMQSLPCNYRTDKMSAPASWADLLDPKWKGKIVSWSPGQGAGASIVPMFLNPKVGEEWFRRWATEMNVTIVSDARQGAEWVALGRFPIGMFGLNTQAEALKDQGFPIMDYLPHPMAEGEVLWASAANLMVLDKAPNPNAAKLFVNWALSREGQSAIIKAAEKTDSLRVDVPNDVLEPQYRIDPKADYIVAFSNPEFITRQDEVLAKLKQIMSQAGYK